MIAIVVLLTLNWRLALTALAIIPGVMLMSFIFARRVRPIYRSVRKDAEQIDGRVGETFSGIRVVRAFRRELRELLDYMRGRHTVLRKELFAHRRELVLWTSWGLLLAAVNVVIVWYGGYLNIVGRASIGDIMAFQWYTFLLLNPVWNIVNSFSELQRSLAAMERVFEVLGDGRATSPTGPTRATRRRSCARSVFEDVEFEYREGRPVVRDFNVVVPGGTVVALVGRSGAGKTTVTDLVARFHDPTRGRILLNGIDIRDFRLRTYRDLLAIVQQDVFLFDGSVRDNIAYGRHDATDAEVEDAARRANAHEFIDQAARGIRDVHRRARRQALGRPAAAPGDRAGDPRVAADPDPRRSDQQPRHRERAADPGVDGDAARRADDVRDRASPVHDPARRPDPADGGRPRHRARHARGADGARAASITRWCCVRWSRTRRPSTRPGAAARSARNTSHRDTETTELTIRRAARCAATDGGDPRENESHERTGDSFSRGSSPSARWPASPANPSNRTPSSRAQRRACIPFSLCLRASVVKIVSGSQRGRDSAPNPFPDWIEPMAATLTQERFSGPEWIFERKFDGIRLLAFKQGDDVRLFSRNRLPQHNPAMTEAIASTAPARADPRRRGNVARGGSRRATTCSISSGSTAAT